MTTGPVEKGSKLPAFRLPTDDGGTVGNPDLAGRPAVIYFYPKDDTPGCIAEACSFRDQYEDFEQLGAKVIGISGDSVKSHAGFAKRYRLNFTLLSDQNRKAENAFGVERNMFGLIPGRVTFVFDQEGKLQHEYNSRIMATRHITEALKGLQKLED
jgi:peroxiredoxin Q/BCP